jgi:hypothetical protein
VRELTLEDARAAGAQAEKFYLGAWNAYAVAWRTLGEAIAIAVTGAALGLIGAALGLAFFGVAGAVLIGLLVGVTTKSFYFAALGAPLGLLFGTMAGGMLWLIGLHGWPLLAGAFLGAALGATLGGRIGGPWGTWACARPFLGAGAGLLFGGLGMLLGAGLRALAISLGG